MPSTELTWRQVVSILNETEIMGDLGYIATIQVESKMLGIFYARKL